LGSVTSLKVIIKVKRVKIKPDVKERYVPKKGIDIVWNPRDINQGIYDVLLQGTPLNPVPNERINEEDIERELQKLNIISDRVRDNNFFQKTYDRKINQYFYDVLDNKDLDEIDEVRSKATEKYDEAKRRFISYQLSSS